MLDFDALVLAPCMAVFGEPVIYTSGLGQVSAITGIFDYANVDLLPMGGAREQEGQRIGAAGGINTRRPILGVRESDFLTPPRANDTAALPGRGLVFVVKSVQPDGKGGIMLLLARAATAA